MLGIKQLKKKVSDLYEYFNLVYSDCTCRNKDCFCDRVNRVDADFQSIWKRLERLENVHKKELEKNREYN